MTRRALRTVMLLAALMAAALLPAAAATGDVNADGAIDLRDALALCRFLAGTGGPLADPAAADANGDGMVDDADVGQLLLASLGEPLPTRTFSVEPPMLDFMAVLAGSTAELGVTLTSQGMLPLTVQMAALDPASSADFSIVSPPALPQTLGPGESIVVTVRYAPGGAGEDAGELGFTTDAGPATVGLIGLGIAPALDVSPIAVDFGDVAVGASDSAAITLANVGSAPLTIQSVAPGPATSPDFTVGAPGASLLAPGESTAVQVTYAPQEAGEDSGRVDVLSDGGTAEVTLAGRGVAPLLDFDPDVLDFGMRLVGSTTTLFFDVRNPGTAPLVVGSIALSLDTAPSLALGTLPALPFTILPGEALAVGVTFAPLAVGPAAGRVDVQSNAGNGQVLLAGSAVRPEIAISPGMADFGNVLVGDSATATLRISNAGSATLTVESIVFSPGTSADFALPSPPAGILALAPGEFYDLAVSYEPGEVGPDTGELQIASDDPTTPLALVPLQGNGVAPEFVLQPASLDFGSVRVGQSADLSFEILNTGGTTLSVVAVAVGDGAASFSLVAPPALPADLDPGASLSVTVRFSPAAGGAASGRVDVATSAGAGEVPLAGLGVLPAIALAPESVDFGSAPVSGSADATVTVSNVGSAPLVVSAIAPLSGSDPAFSVVSTPPLPATLSTGGSFEVLLRFSPSAAGPVAGTVRFTSDDPMRPSVDLPLTGTGVGGAFLQVAPGTVDFGELAIGVPAAATLTLSNTGDAPLTVLSAALTAGSSPEFDVGAPSDSQLDPGETATLGVGYTPADAGLDDGAVEIATSANTVVVPLTGRGAEAVVAVALTLNVAAESLVTGECLDLHATAQYSDGSSADVTDTAVWSSSAPPVAAVDAAGRVTALAPGSAMVTATLGALTAQSAITVGEPGTVRLVLPCGEVAPGATLEAKLRIDSGAAPLGAYAVRLLYDPGLVVIDTVEGGAAGTPFAATPFSHPPHFVTGDVVIAAWQASSLTAPTGASDVAIVRFDVTGPAGASGRIEVEVVELVGTDLGDLASTVSSSRVGVAP